MEAIEINDNFLSQLKGELVFSFSRSSGPGGQHANKVSTRVELKFNINGSEVLTPEQKDRINQQLKNRISKDGFMILYSQEERSQIKNKQIVTNRFIDLIKTSLTPEKERIPVQPSTSSKIKRLEEKSKQSQLKKYRKKPAGDNNN